MSYASRVETGNPSPARRIPGSSSSSKGSVPKRSWASTHAATAPGTVTERAPEPGTRSTPCSRKNPGVASRPALPLPLIALISPVAPS